MKQRFERFVGGGLRQEKLVWIRKVRLEREREGLFEGVLACLFFPVTVKTPSAGVGTHIHIDFFLARRL